MSRETALIVLGVLVALSPYLGLPLSILGIVLPILGLVILGIGVTLRMRVVQSTRSDVVQIQTVSAHDAPEA